jgi:asparagine synthase (glutamine-hydrolysing)
MCGIVGLVAWKSATQEKNQITCKKMTAALSHRGNDGEGFFCSTKQQAFLGHRRLSIFDTSSAGNQPMTTKDGRFTLVYNGEIYNFKELKEELAPYNITFTSSSDTEVLLYGYALFKENIFKKLRGMFAGALWDEKEKELIVFRDHLGIKPLFWWKDEKQFVCASELKAFKQHPDISLELNKNAVAEFFQFGSIHPPITIFKNVFSLKPGHFLKIKEQETSLHQFWSLNEIKTEEHHESSATIKEQIKSSLRNSVAHHVLSDIPVGAFLSGGIDSSTIVALMKEQLSGSFDTFSLGFGKEGRYLDESAYAVQIAHFFGTRHHHILCSGEFFKEDLDLFVQHLDQPTTDGFNSFLISQSTKNRVSVALSGLGGDELFLGYKYHRNIAQLQQLQTSRFRPALSLLSASAQKIELIKRIINKTKLKGIEEFNTIDSSEGYFAARRLFNDKQLLFEDTKKIDPADHFKQINELFTHESDLLNAYSKAELAFYTAGTLLPDGDITGMAFTLEVRFPFLDIPLVTQMLSLPSSYKIDLNSPTPKKLLHSILSDFIPERFFLQEKRGFEMPIGFWLKQHPELYEPLRESTFLHQIRLKETIERFEKQPQNYLSLWAPLIFSKWLAHNNLTL